MGVREVEGVVEGGWREGCWWGGVTGQKRKKKKEKK